MQVNLPAAFRGLKKTFAGPEVPQLVDVPELG
jgi:hypothetical protein